MWLVSLRNSSSIACSWCLVKSLLSIFALHLILTLQKNFYCSLFNAREEYHAEFLFCYSYIACSLYLKAIEIAAFHCMCLAHCKIMLLLVKHCMMLTLCYLQNPCSADFTLHAAHTLRRSGSVLLYYIWLYQNQNYRRAYFRIILARSLFL